MANCRLRSRSQSRPKWRAPIIFNSPHSGSVYPHEFLNASRIDLGALRRSEDSFMDELIGGLSERGFPVVRVNFPRSYVDVNREPYELDPRMFSGRLPSFANTRSMRVAGGLGTIPRVVGDGQEIYRERLWVDDALARIEALYKPYHRALRRLINKAHQAFGDGDRGGLPLDALDRRFARRAAAAGRGDRRPLRHQLRAAAARHGRGNHGGLGYSVGRNKPYAGGFITEHYGNPASGLHTIQLELNRAIYMDERRRERGAAVCASGRGFRCAGRRAGGGSAWRSRAVPGRGGIAARSPGPVIEPAASRNEFERRHDAQTRKKGRLNEQAAQV